MHVGHVGSAIEKKLINSVVSTCRKGHVKHCLLYPKQEIGFNSRNTPIRYFLLPLQITYTEPDITALYFTAPWFTYIFY